MIVTAAYRANYALIEWHTVERPITRPERTGNRAPYVISDTMEPTMHMATGQVLDSKHKFRQITREHGLDEVGNEKMTPRTPTTVPRPGPDIKRAIEELRGR